MERITGFFCQAALVKGMACGLVLLCTSASLEAGSPSRYESQDGYRMFQSALPFALKAHPEAIHDCFMASYLRASSPFLGGEDLESIASGMAQLLFTLGDRAFSEALAVERPEVIAAVKWARWAPGFYQGTKFKRLDITKYPKTLKLLETTADVDFPIDERSPRRERLLKQLLREER